MVFFKKIFIESTNVFIIIPESMVLLLIRFGVAVIFWRSVQTKINGWEIFGQSFQFYNLGSNTFTLFRYEYAVPILTYTQSAYLATFAEFFFSIMLAVGFGTRIAALGLIGVTAVIQLFVYPLAWQIHMFWFLSLLVLLKYGSGKFSLDKLLFNLAK